ncbi:Signal transduction histidine kinase CheA [Labilithrix luteola]|uniref:histidine kinase n=1 Tax=Labilithrix luteola TaxID=1391654 RepID=A0A0K1PMT2_9BACT|nr:ATP-binding protein [Labilithrix luteola]AKU94838.1 Signal transduction histidine kinase CheA [Labilithrix luteola]
MSSESDNDKEREAAKAHAAQRTIEVLKQKVFDLYNKGSNSILHRQLESARRREENTRQKRELVEMRAAELKRYSETLEAEVAQRTEAVKTILDNVTFGFLVINRELTVQPECTKSCHRLFGADKVEGENLCQLLGMNERARLTFGLSADQVFEDVLPEEASLAQMARKFPTQDGRVLRIDASAVRSKQGDVTGLLLTISDMTALEAATKESNNNRTLVNILRQKEAFRVYLVDARHLIDSARRAVGANDQAGARRALHTLKGNSASYGLDTLVETIHHVEEDLTVKATQVDDVEHALRTFIESNKRVLEIEFEEVEQREGFAVTHEQMAQLKALIASIQDARAAELNRWTAEVLRKPAGLVLGPVEDFSQKLATRLGKDVSFQLVGADTTVDVETVRPVFQVISHLLRNAIDHGLEAPVERKGKPATGKLELELSETANAYVVRCSDDGRGIDPHLVGKRALELGFVSAQALSQMDERKKLDVIFIDGLSTATITTSISGRGVGMSAVRAAVQKVGGAIDVRSAVGSGTTFTITIPKSRENGTAPSNMAVS